MKEKLAVYLPGITEIQAEKLKRYLEFLLDYNTRLNLTAITSFDEAIVKHLGDSLAGAAFIPKETKRLLDIGSGGGCPAIPLKIARPDISLTMTDGIGKKADFLNAAVKHLGLEEAEAVKERAEEIARTDRRESFDIVTARAVAALPILLELASPLIKVGGRFLAYKGDGEDEIEAAKGAAKALEMQLIETYGYTLEGGHARKLLIYKKTAATPAEYPRRYSRIIKQPL